MKRCPECRRDYYDDTLLYCLDDGNALLEGPASVDEPATAILSEPGAVATGFPASESPTRAQINTTDQTAIFPRGTEAEPQNLGELTERQSLSANRAAEPRGKVVSRQWLFAVFGIAVLLLVGGFFAYRYFSPIKQINSIAVLPFENVSGNADLDYLSDGVSESVIDRLSQLPQLKVIARSSSFRYRGQNLNLQEIANALGVQAIVTGRVVPRGDSYQIRVELVDVREDKQLWGETFNRKASDVQILQTDISREIADNLRLRLSGTQTQQLAAQGTINSQAYELRLKGRYYFNKFSSLEDFHKSVEYYEQAVAVDPNYALAWAELAESYEFGGGRGLDRDQRRGKREAAGRKSLEINPNLAETHFALANLKRDSWDWEEAEREYRRTIELNPSLSGPHGAYAALLSYLKRFDEAITESERRTELDPLSSLGNTASGDVYFRARRYDEAVGFYQRVLELNPASPVAHQRLGDAYTAQGRYDEAVAAYQKSLSLRSGDEYPYIEAMLATAYARGGGREKAEEILQKLKTDGNIQPRVLAILYAALGNKIEAFTQLEKAFAVRDAGLRTIAVEPYFDDLRGEARFQDLLRRMGLPE